MKTNLIPSLFAALLGAALFAPHAAAEDKPAAQAKPSKPALVKVPYLGIAPTTLDAALSAQLGLPEGVGLLVRAVQPGSPAEKAGVKQHDVLHYFNDQLLINEAQLQALVRQAGTGAEAALKVLRRGAAETVTVKLGEHEAPASPTVDVLHWRGMQPGPRGAHDWQHFAFPLNSEAFTGQIRELSERLKALEGRPEKWKEELERFQKELKEQTRKFSDEEVKKAGSASRPKDNSVKIEVPTVKVDKAANGTYQVHILGGDGKADVGSTAVVTATADGSGNVLISQSSSSRTSWSDNDGSGELEVKDGKKHLTARDSGGKEIYSGPVDTEEQRAKLPAGLRERLDRIEKNVKVEVRVDAAAKP